MAYLVVPAPSMVAMPVAAESGVLVTIPDVKPPVLTTAPGEYSDVSSVLPAVVTAVVVLLYVKLLDLHLFALDSSFHVGGYGANG